MNGMSMRDFKHLVRQVMETLPAEIAAHTGNVVVEVADKADEELLHRAGFKDEEIDDGADLFGLFEPFGGLDVDGVEIGDRPNKLWVFKLPHEEEFPDPKRLRTEIRKTVIHELGHHFGFDERDLERFDANPDPFGD